MVAACEAYVVECQDCMSILLVREPVRKMDSFQCPACNNEDTIDMIVSSCREGDGSAFLNAEFLE